MKQSSKLLLACLLSINFASFAMDQKAPEAETPIEAFKREAKELNQNEFRRLRSTVKNPISLCAIFAETPGINMEIGKSIIQVAGENQKLHRIPESSVYTLLQKHKFPLAESDATEALVDPNGTSCLNPIVMSLFSQKFRALIQKRKTALITQKTEDGEDIEKWSLLEKQAFGVGLLNTELKALKDEFLTIHDSVTPFCNAVEEIHREHQRRELEEKLEELAMLMTINSIFERHAREEIGLHIHRHECSHSNQENGANSPKTDKSDKTE